MKIVRFLLLLLASAAFLPANAQLPVWSKMSPLVRQACRQSMRSDVARAKSMTLSSRHIIAFVKANDNLSSVVADVRGRLLAHYGSLGIAELPVSACGLMQIMPRTADHLGLSRSELFNPEANIAASARYLQELGRHYEDVPVGERVYFQIASYNGGFFHIRDAMALARKHGRNPHRWDDVSEFILLLSNPQYYTDPVVRYGYMRGRETVDYVNRIRDRYAQYRGVAHRGSGSYFPDPGSSGMRPERARKNYKWHL